MFMVRRFIYIIRPEMGSGQVVDAKKYAVRFRSRPTR